MQALWHSKKEKKEIGKVFTTLEGKDLSETKYKSRGRKKSMVASWDFLGVPKKVGVPF